MFTLFQIIKNFLKVFFITFILAPFRKIAFFIFYLIEMNVWIWKNKNSFLLHCFNNFVRNYRLRESLYSKFVSHYSLIEKKIAYLEFEVSVGSSFRWWLSSNHAPNGKFVGFNTFDGLPENRYGLCKKEDMATPIPDVNDPRAKFEKGIFQDTLPNFLQKNRESIIQAYLRIIHCGTHLYSSTIFILSQLYPFLRKGDMILFAEFNVPMLEFKAFIEFTKNFYVSLKSNYSSKYVLSNCI